MATPNTEVKPDPFEQPKTTENARAIREKLLGDARASRSKFAMDIMWLWGEDKKAAVAEIRQMFIDLMDSTEQTGVDSALTDAVAVFDKALKSKEGM